jgi:plastocyanin
VRRRTTAAGLIVASALVVACSPADEPEPRLAELDQDPVATLVVDDDGFSPSELELTSGDTVMLVNEGDDPHSFRATDPVRDTGEVLPGEEVLLRFDEVGTVDGHDGTAPDHEVTIEVVEDPEAED